jgi:hypothetical protein
MKKTIKIIFITAFLITAFIAGAICSQLAILNTYYTNLNSTTAMIKNLKRNLKPPTTTGWKMNEIFVRDNCTNNGLFDTTINNRTRAIYTRIGMFACRDNEYQNFDIKNYSELCFLSLENKSVGNVYDQKKFFYNPETKMCYYED